MNAEPITKSEEQDPQALAEVSDVRPVSPHNQAIYEAGKKMLIDSVDVGRSFSQFMITLSSSLIMVYIGILQFIWGKETLAPTLGSALYLLPPIFFLVSCALFIISYFPRTDNYSLDILEEIKTARRRSSNTGPSLLKSV